MAGDKKGVSKSNKPKLTTKEKKAAKKAKELEKAGGIPLPKAPS